MTECCSDSIKLTSVAVASSQVKINQNLISIKQVKPETRFPRWLYLDREVLENLRVFNLSYTIIRFSAILHNDGGESYWFINGTVAWLEHWNQLTHGEIIGTKAEVAHSGQQFTGCWLVALRQMQTQQSSRRQPASVRSQLKGLTNRASAYWYTTMITAAKLITFLVDWANSGWRLTLPIAVGLRQYLWRSCQFYLDNLNWTFLKNPKWNFSVSARETNIKTWQYADNVTWNFAHIISCITFPQSLDD